MIDPNLHWVSNNIWLHLMLYLLAQLCFVQCLSFFAFTDLSSLPSSVNKQSFNQLMTSLRKLSDAKAESWVGFIWDKCQICLRMHTFFIHGQQKHITIENNAVHGLIAIPTFHRLDTFHKLLNQINKTWLIRLRTWTSYGSSHPH